MVADGSFAAVLFDVLFQRQDRLPSRFAGCFLHLAEGVVNGLSCSAYDLF